MTYENHRQINAGGFEIPTNSDREREYRSILQDEKLGAYVKCKLEFVAIDGSTLTVDPIEGVDKVDVLAPDVSEWLGFQTKGQEQELQLQQGENLFLTAPERA